MGRRVPPASRGAPLAPLPALERPAPTSPKFGSGSCVKKQRAPAVSAAPNPPSFHSSGRGAHVAPSGTGAVTRKLRPSCSEAAASSSRVTLPTPASVMFLATF
jgi:hypothetical protein